MSKYLDILNEELTNLEEGISEKEKAKAIRVLLKEKFPKTKFSVTSKGAINIRYTDGPALILVERLVKGFEEIDYDEATQEILSGGNTFVFVKRDISDKNKEIVKEYIAKQFDGIGNTTELQLRQMIDSNVYFAINTMDFDKKISFTRNERGSANNTYFGNMGKDKRIKDLAKKGLIY